MLECREGETGMYKTMEQINEEYNGQWVFLINCERSEYHSVAGGEVVLSTGTKKEMFQQVETFWGHDSETFLFYAGGPPKGVNFLL